MNPAPLFLVLVIFGILGSVFLGLVAGLANVITNEYVDYSLPENPIVQEYDFRVGGKYEFVTVFLLVSGSVLAICGNIIGIYEYQAAKQRSQGEKEIVSEQPLAKLLAMCPQCQKKLPIDSKFCPKCGADFCETFAHSKRAQRL